MPNSTSKNRDMVVCITAAGRRVQLMRTLRKDAIDLGLRPRFLALDQVPTMSAACQEAEIVNAVPACDEPGYVQAVIDACRRHGATMVIPTIDLDLQVLAEAAERMESEGISPLISQPMAIKVARNKLLTSSVLASMGVLVPATLLLSEAMAAPTSAPFPAIIKPVDGSSSKGLHYLSGWEDLPKPAPVGDHTLFQEHCIGPEFTVNAYVDAYGVLRCVVPHRRIEVRGGEVNKGRTERRPDLLDIARKVVAAVPGLRGPFCFQCIVTDNGPKVFEINARFGGGYPLAHAAGATFGKWAIQEHLGIEPDFHDEWTDGLLMLRYDDAFFIPRES